MNPKTSILIADDHPIFRAGLKQIIEADHSLTVIGEAEDGDKALQLIEQLQPGVAILDINMPTHDGFEVAKEIKQKKLTSEIVFLTMHSEEAMFNRAISLGVKGYVLKDSAVTDIVTAIKAVISGQHFTSPAITSYLFKRTLKPEAIPTLDDLSPTERKIIRLIAEYKTSKEMADELCISYRTIENYRSNICTKLGLKGSHALIKFALKHQSEL